MKRPGRIYAREPSCHLAEKPIVISLISRVCCCLGATRAGRIASSPEVFTIRSQAKQKPVQKLRIRFFTVPKNPLPSPSLARNACRLPSPALGGPNRRKPLYVKYALHVSFFHFTGSVHHRRFRYFSSVIASRSTALPSEQRYVSVLSTRARPPLTPRPVSASLYLSIVRVYGNVHNLNLTIESLCR